MLLFAGACNDYHLGTYNTVELSVSDASWGPTECGGTSVFKVSEDGAATVDGQVSGYVKTIDGRWKVAGSDAGTADFEGCFSSDECSTHFAYTAGTPAAFEKIKLTVEVGDAAGISTLSDSVSIYTDQKPAGEMVAPADGSRSIYGDTVAMIGTAWDTEDCSTQLNMSFYSSLDGLLAEDVAVDGFGLGQLNISNLTVGDHALYLKVTDSMQQSSFSSTMTFTVWPQESCNGIDDDGDGEIPADEVDNDGDGYRLCNGDCNDQDATVHPNAPELCDDIDNDCDGEIEDPGLEVWDGWDNDCDGTVDQIPLETADANYIGEEGEDHAGLALASAGDVDGDGLGDVLIAAPHNDYAGTGTGALYLILGKTIAAYSGAVSIDLSMADYIFTGIDSEVAGISVAGLGDVNGDGYADFLVGAYHNYMTDNSAGAAYLVPGRADFGTAQRQTLADVAAVVYYGEASQNWAGYSVAAAGDVNADGFMDYLIGAPGASNSAGSTQAGKTYLLFGYESPECIPEVYLADVSTVFEGENTGDESGFSVSGAGDTNGDGYGDILIGAFENGEAGDGAGKTYLILGREDFGVEAFSLANADEMFLGETAWDFSAYAVSGTGDLNGDGLTDFAIGAPYNDESYDKAGKIYVVLGKTSFGSHAATSLAAADYALLGTESDVHAGLSLSSLGDVDQDGRADFVVGEPKAHDENVGESYVIMGNVLTERYSIGDEIMLWDASALFWGEYPGDYSGYTVAAAGDVTGDGYPELLIGAYANDEGGDYGAGKAYLVLNYFGE